MLMGARYPLPGSGLPSLRGQFLISISPTWFQLLDLQEAQRLLFYSRKEVKQCSKELNDHLATLDAAATANLAKAERENSVRGCSLLLWYCKIRRRGKEGLVSRLLPKCQTWLRKNSTFVENCVTSN